MIAKFDSKISNKYFTTVIMLFQIYPHFFSFSHPTTTTYTMLMGYFSEFGNLKFKNQAKNIPVDLTLYPIKI